MTTATLITLSDSELTRYFFAVMLLLCSAHVFGYLFLCLKMPRVIGEIFGGIVLGPSFFGHFFSDYHHLIFTGFAAEPKLISAIYWTGLVLLMFISGFEIDTSFNKNDRKTVLWVLAGSTIIPFMAGWFAPDHFDVTPLIGPKQNLLALKIIISIAFAVTSIPVISKIFLDLDIINTRFAKIVIATATLHDVILWAALAVATGIVSTSTLNMSAILSTVLLTIVFFLLSFLILPHFFHWFAHHRLNLLIKSSLSGYVLFVCFLFSAITSILDINIVFGALLAGIILGTTPDERFKTVKAQIKDFSLAFFIPIYFAVVGLKLDLLHHFDPVLLLTFLLLSAFFQSLGTFLSAKMAGKNNLSSLNLSVAMNTRGGPGIVLATIAFDLGIISEIFFVTLVLVAIVTSLLAGMWFRMVLKREWELLSQ